MPNQDKCMVCGALTDKCIPSPFLPYSGWRCETCIEAHRIPLDDLLGIMSKDGQCHSYDEALQAFDTWWQGSENINGDHPDPGVGANYAEKYWLATMEFFGLTKEMVGAKMDEFHATHYPPPAQ